MKEKYATNNKTHRTQADKLSSGRSISMSLGSSGESNVHLHITFQG